MYVESITKENFVCRRFVPKDFLSLWLFCKFGCFVPPEVLSLTFCPLVFFPSYVLSSDVLPWYPVAVETF
jgi:hypothetical protein